MDANPDAVDEYMAALDGDAHTIASQVRQAIHRANPVAHRGNGDLQDAVLESPKMSRCWR
jgi:hypothetical protein